MNLMKDNATRTIEHRIKTCRFFRFFLHQVNFKVTMYIFIMKLDADLTVHLVLVICYHLCQLQKLLVTFCL